MFSYGVGEVGYLVQEQGFNLLFLFYYQQIVGLPGTLIGGILLDVIKFPEQAQAGTVPDDIIWQLGFVSGPAVAVIAIAGIGLFFYYDLSHKRHAEIRRELLTRMESTRSNGRANTI